MAVWPLCLSFFLLFALDASVAEPLTGKGDETFTLVRQDTCESGWFKYESRSFRFFNHPRSWIDAEKECLGYSGNLASVHSYEEYTFVQDLIKSQTQASTPAWIGGYTPIWMQRSWLWSDGSNMNIEIWAPGEPNKYTEKEHCILMNYESSSNWNDYSCDVKRAFVCVKK